MAKRKKSSSAADTGVSKGRGGAAVTKRKKSSSAAGAGAAKGRGGAAVTKRRKAGERKVEKLEAEAEALSQKVASVTAELRRETEILNEDRLEQLLPPELWGKIFDHLSEDALFPAAMSCKYFRKRQQDLAKRGKRMRTTLSVDDADDKFSPSPSYLSFLFYSSGGLSEDAKKRKKYCLSAAAYHGHPAVVKSFTKAGCPWFIDTMHYAALGGQLQIIKYGHSRGGEFDSCTTAWAASGGHLKVLQWLRKQGCPWDHGTCSCAAEGGHLEIIKWARRNGCPWNASVCKAAAGGKQFHILKYLRSEGCPWDARTCENAAKRG